MKLSKAEQAYAWEPVRITEQDVIRFYFRNLAGHALPPQDGNADLAYEWGKMAYILWRFEDKSLSQLHRLTQVLPESPIHYYGRDYDIRLGKRVRHFQYRGRSITSADILVGHRARGFIHKGNRLGMLLFMYRLRGKPMSDEEFPKVMKLMNENENVANKTRRYFWDKYDEFKRVNSVGLVESAVV